MKIKKAVVAAAGLATRFLPTTKVIPKPLIPLLNKPVIQYIIDELVSSEITQIIMIISEDGELLKRYFESKPELVSELKRRNKDEYAGIVEQTNAKVEMVFMTQGPEGNGAPILRAEELLRGEPFVMCFADDVVFSKIPFTTQLIRAFEKYHAPILGVQEAEVEQIMTCGCVALKPGTTKVLEVIEKPQREQIKSNLIEFGRMILTKEIVEVLKTTARGRGGELWLMDAIQKFIVQGGSVYAEAVQGGAWYTTGDPWNHLKASIALAKKDPILSEKLERYLLNTI